MKKLNTDQHHFISYTAIVGDDHIEEGSNFAENDLDSDDEFEEILRVRHFDREQKLYLEREERRLHNEHQRYLETCMSTSEKSEDEMNEYEMGMKTIFLLVIYIPKRLMNMKKMTVLMN